MKRLWGIRHVRYVYLKIRLYQWFVYCRSRGLGYFINESDLDYLDAVWKGRV